MPNAPLDVGQLVQRTFVARVEHHRTLGSTNDRAKQCAAAGAGRLPLLIVADAQTAGRGRGTSHWWTGRGSLALSLLFDPRRSGIGPSGRPLVALGTAVAVADTVAPLLAGHMVGIHWPNDVVASGRKLSGILVEILSPSASFPPVESGLCVVGIGLNTNNTLDEAPADLRETATTVFELTGARQDQTAVLTALLDKLAETFGQLADDPAQVARRADALCLQHGRTLVIQSGGAETAGRCAGIAEDGALLLDTPAGRQWFYSGRLR